MEESKEQLKESNKKIKNEEFLKDLSKKLKETGILTYYIKIINIYNEVFKSIPLSEIKEVLEENKRISELSQDDYNEHFKNEIEMHEAIGNYGWVLGLKLWLDDAQQIYNLIKQGVEEKKLVKFFFKNKEDVFKYFDSFSEKYKQMTNLKLFFDKALICYKSNDFSSALFYIVAVFERRFEFFIPNYRMTKRAVDGLKKHREDYFNQLKTNNKGYDYIKTYYLLYFLPSFSAFCKRLFVDGDEHDFNEGTEPKYLNRNWFIHGKMTRDVEEYEVLQLLKALMTLEDAMEYCAH